MPTQLWVALVLFLVWFCLPVSLMIANWEFNGESVDEKGKRKSSTHHH